jgi:hypothetical protein
MWAAVAIVCLAAVAFVAYRLGWYRWALQHRILTGGAVAIMVAISIPGGWYTISPLFERETVCEASPIAGAGAGSEKCEGVAMAAANPTGIPADTAKPVAGAATPSVSAPEMRGVEHKLIAKGEFHGADDFHFGRGQALLIETTPGQFTLRFEDFSVRNGPDLFVYLSTDSAGYSEDALLLGDLKGTDGAFNYDIPSGTDVSQYKSAVVWCKAFSVLFATASFA